MAEIMLTYCLKGGTFRTEYFPSRELAVARAKKLDRSSKGFSIEPRIHKTDSNLLGKMAADSSKDELEGPDELLSFCSD